MESKYAILIKYNNKIDKICTDLENNVLLKMIDYVLEIVDSLINTTNFWFTVVSPRVLLNNVCSLGIRKYVVNNNINIFFCYCIQSQYGLHLFEKEITEYTDKIFSNYKIDYQTQENDIREISLILDMWYENCIGYLSNVIQVCRNCIPELIFMCCINESFSEFVDNDENKIVINKFMKYNFIDIDRCNVSNIGIPLNINNEMLNKISNHLICINPPDPITYKTIINKILLQIYESYKLIIDILKNGTRDYYQFQIAYLKLLKCDYRIILIAMLKKYNGDDIVINECINVIDDHLKKK